MKTVKSLLLAGVAALAASSVAQAADLPAAEPVEYVRICDAYGVGFFFIPGTDTCLRISGLVRFDIQIGSDNWVNPNPGVLSASGQTGITALPTSIITPSFTYPVVFAPGIGLVNPFTTGTTAPWQNLTVAQGAALVPAFPGAGVAVFAGSATPVSPTFIGQPTFANNNLVIGPANGLRLPNNTWILGQSPINDQLVMGVRALLRFDARSNTEWGVLRSFFEFAANSNNTANNGNALQIRYGFVQFGLFGGVVTAGVTDSFFNGDNGPWFQNYQSDRTTRLPLLAYTANFGNGFSATISIEDSEAAQGTGGSTGLLLFNGTGTAGTLEGWQRRSVQLPDLVGNLRVQQAWGSAWVSGMVGQSRFVNNTCALSLTLICSDDEVGWAVGGGVRINLPMLAAGSNLMVKATYADGALQYLGNVQTASFWGSSVLPIAPGVSLGGFDGSVNRMTGWSVYGHLQHFFTPALRAAIGGSYAEIDPRLNGAVGNNFVLFRRGYQVMGQLIWSPVRNLDLGVEVFYAGAEYDAFAGFLGTSSGVVGTTRDDAWGAVFRIQRSF